VKDIGVTTIITPQLLKGRPKGVIRDVCAIHYRGTTGNFPVGLGMEGLLHGHGGEE
jgi:hypothetical protein